MAIRLIQLDSANEVRSVSTDWNDLWQRSEVALPIARAELIAQWLDHYGPNAKVKALAVEQDGRFIAALPLVRGRLKGALPIARLPRNNWSWAGDLLVDPAIEPAALEAFVNATARVGRPLVGLDAVPFEVDQWQRFTTAANDAGLSLHTRESFRVGQIEIDHDWPVYQRSWSRNHRRQMQRIERDAETLGGAKLVIHRQFEPHEVEPLLRRGFEIENSGWKGRAGSSALTSPDVFAFYLEQARQIAALGQLQITFLEVAGQAIAFEYGWNAKGIYHSFKVGYDEAFARLSPGQLLRLHLLRRLFADPTQRAVDFIGPLTDATAKWSTSTYPVGRFLLSANHFGRLLIRAYRSLRPHVGVQALSHSLQHGSRDQTKKAPDGQATSPNRRAPAPLT